MRSKDRVLDLLKVFHEWVKTQLQKKKKIRFLVNKSGKRKRVGNVGVGKENVLGSVDKEFQRWIGVLCDCSYTSASW